MKTNFFSTHPCLHRLIVISLYALPVIFFLISYFLITTSGEDIWQGAHNFRTGLTIDPLQDAINAFNFNSRITDMYAWTVIDFFDYQFAFGPDLIFRLIDVAMVSLTFYLATYLILNRKPTLHLKDALVFCATFFLFIISPFGRPFYHEFSMIHNYVPLALVTLLFSIPYLNLAQHRPPQKHLRLFAFGLLFLGILFGMSATITPLAFLLTIIIYCIIKRKTLKRPPLWFFTGIIGTIIGFSICWFAGSGIDHYTSTSTALTFDYVSVGDIFSSPATAIPRLLFHEIYNFGITLLPLICIVLASLVFTKNRRQFFTKSFYTKLPKSFKAFALILSIFLIVHLLGASLVKAPPRLILPAYLAGLILSLRFFVPHLNSKLLGMTVVIFTTLTLIIHTSFRIIYHQDMSLILKEIESSPTTELCITPDRLAPPRLKLIDLSQANILVDWGTPEIIHQHSVTFCKP